MKRFIFDPHAHRDDEASDSDYEGLLQRLPEQGMCNVVSMGTDYDRYREALEFASRCSYIYTTVGIHPGGVVGLPEDYLSQVEEWPNAPKAIATGEIGLGYHYEDVAPREVQQKVFEDQILLAKRRNLSTAVHDREARGDTMGILYRHRPRGVVRCFSDSVEMIRKVVKLGMYIGLNGVVTFKNVWVTVKMAREISLDHLLMGTSMPYLALEPFRDRRCGSFMIRYVVQHIAEIRGITADEVLAAGRRNVEALPDTIAKG